MWIMVKLVLALLVVDGLVWMATAGIAGFHKFFEATFKEAVNEDPTTLAPCSHLCIDLNQLLHQAMTGKGASVSRGLRFRLRRLLGQFRPTRSVVIAIDGSAPLAKLITQRKRRLAPLPTDKKKRAKTLEKLALSPGTRVMDEMDKTVAAIALECMKRQMDKGRRPSTFYISGSRSPGEGELKIFDWLMTGMATHTQQNTRICIVGGDADLLLQAMALPEVLDIHVLVPTMRSKPHPKTQKKKQASAAVPPGEVVPFRAYSLRKLCEVLKWYSIDVDKWAARLDFILLMILNGNDYVPRLPGVGFDNLLEAYKQLKRRKAFADRTIVQIDVRDGGSGNGEGDGGVRVSFDPEMLCALIDELHRCWEFVVSLEALHRVIWRQWQETDSLTGEEKRLSAAAPAGILNDCIQQKRLHAVQVDFESAPEGHKAVLTVQVKADEALQRWEATAADKATAKRECIGKFLLATFPQDRRVATDMVAHLEMQRRRSQQRANAEQAEEEQQTSAIDQTAEHETLLLLQSLETDEEKRAVGNPSAVLNLLKMKKVFGSSAFMLDEERASVPGGYIRNATLAVQHGGCGGGDSGPPEEGALLSSHHFQGRSAASIKQAKASAVMHALEELSPPLCRQLARFGWQLDGSCTPGNVTEPTAVKASPSAPTVPPPSVSSSRPPPVETMFPAVDDYLEAIRWCVAMYAEARCSDWCVRYTAALGNATGTRAPTPYAIRERLKGGPQPQQAVAGSTMGPLPSELAALAVLPVQGGLHLLEPWLQQVCISRSLLSRPAEAPRAMPVAPTDVVGSDSRPETTDVDGYESEGEEDEEECFDEVEEMSVDQLPSEGLQVSLLDMAVGPQYENRDRVELLQLAMACNSTWLSQSVRGSRWHRYKAHRRKKGYHTTGTPPAPVAEIAVSEMPLFAPRPRTKKPQTAPRQGPPTPPSPPPQARLPTIDPRDSNTGDDGAAVSVPAAAPAPPPPPSLRFVRKPRRRRKLPSPSSVSMMLPAAGGDDGADDDAQGGVPTSLVLDWRGDKRTVVGVGVKGVSVRPSSTRGRQAMSVLRMCGRWGAMGGGGPVGKAGVSVLSGARGRAGVVCR
ncbi:unnamed protein product [Vitrella brassicaformis CCMP3155]|uniref:Xrn1 N-terminal domain-containing protein n=3 Tax=Vitrella brassicaformis TaxID=1169539 RepID=A0A0G4GNI5_VITBC|nr:unnamed protein product [Vitrella brassicaformis CCMP3155]|eukprot:CEM31660.1 unnamed protein product [Vitrella brassicaformis CCMP3155]